MIVDKAKIAALQAEVAALTMQNGNLLSEVERLREDLRFANQERSGCDECTVETFAYCPHCGESR